MSRKFQQIFEEVRQKRLCEVMLDFKHAPSVEGFVLGWSEKLVLLQAFDRDTFQLNGFCAIGRRFIKSVDHSQGEETWMEKALRKQGQKLSLPKTINLSGWPGLIEFINRSGQWFSTHLDGKRPNKFFVGKWMESKKTTVWLLDIGPDGDVRDPWTVKFAEITRIHWNDGYTNALVDWAGV